MSFDLKFSSKDEIIQHILNSKLKQARRNLKQNQEEKHNHEETISQINEAIYSNEAEISALISALEKLHLNIEKGT